MLFELSSLIVPILSLGAGVFLFIGGYAEQIDLAQQLNSSTAQRTEVVYITPALTPIYDPRLAWATASEAPLDLSPPISEVEPAPTHVFVSHTSGGWRLPTAHTQPLDPLTKAKGSRAPPGGVHAERAPPNGVSA